jgi:hypothetical protein
VSIANLLNVDFHVLAHPSREGKIHEQASYYSPTLTCCSAANKGSPSGGHATEGKDSAGGVAKAKKEFPEAPDPAIGMQDERGGRGG